MTEDDLLAGYHRLSIAARASGIPEHRTDELKRKADLMALTPNHHEPFHGEFMKRQQTAAASLAEYQGIGMSAASVPFNNMETIEREWGRRK